MKIKKCAVCGADAHTVSPAWDNDQKGFITHCIMKSCGNRHIGYCDTNQASVKAWNWEQLNQDKGI